MKYLKDMKPSLNPATCTTKTKPTTKPTTTTTNNIDKCNSMKKYEHILATRSKQEHSCGQNKCSTRKNTM